METSFIRIKFAYNPGEAGRYGWGDRWTKYRLAAGFAHPFLAEQKQVVNMCKCIVTNAEDRKDDNDDRVGGDWQGWQSRNIRASRDGVGEDHTHICNLHIVLLLLLYIW